MTFRSFILGFAAGALLVLSINITPLLSKAVTFLDDVHTLASAYGWDFIESVMTPVVGDDPIAALEKEIENEKRGIAAREARLERLRACVEDRGRLRSVAAKERPSSVWLG